MKTIVTGSGDLGAATPAFGAVVPRPLLRSRVRSVPGAHVPGRTGRPAVATLPTDPTLDLTATRTV